MSQVKYHIISKEDDLAEIENLLDESLKIHETNHQAAKNWIFLVFGVFIGMLIFFFATPMDSHKLNDLTNSMDAYLDSTSFTDHKEIKVVCIVIPKTLNKLKAEEVEKTWGTRCNTFNVVGKENNPAVLVNDSSNYNEIFFKIKQSLIYAYDKYFDDGDWFLMTKDDTYVIMQNLREMLHSYNYKEPVVFGQKYLEAGYLAQGAIVLSKESLRRLVQESFPDEQKCDHGTKGSGNGDIEFHRCLESADIKQIDTRDQKLRGRIFEVDVEVSLFPTHERNDDRWYWYKLKQGIDFCCSDKPISFQGLKQSKLYLYEYLINMVRTFGTKTEFSVN